MRKSRMSRGRSNRLWKRTAGRSHRRNFKKPTRGGTRF